jgi:hypothetical protein
VLLDSNNVSMEIPNLARMQEFPQQDGAQKKIDHEVIHDLSLAYRT